MHRVDASPQLIARLHSHLVAGDYANGGCRRAYAGALTLVGEQLAWRLFAIEICFAVLGGSRWTMDRLQFMEFNKLGTSGDGHGSAVPNTYKRWLLEQSNMASRRANRRPRFPNVNELSPDNGEAFLEEYFKQQKLREAEPGWKAHVAADRKWLCCPCSRCTSRRQTCKCSLCKKTWEHHQRL